MRLGLIVLLSLAAPLGLAQDTVPANAGDAVSQAPATAPGGERVEAGGTKAQQLAEIEALEPAVNVSAGAPTESGAARGAAIQRYQAMDELDLGTTSITGNQELPKVLYIVPWKKSDLGDLVGRPVNTLLDEVLAPVEPEVFERHLDYYDALHGAGAEE